MPEVRTFPAAAPAAVTTPAPVQVQEVQVPVATSMQTAVPAVTASGLHPVSAAAVGDVGSIIARLVGELGIGVPAAGYTFAYVAACVVAGWIIVPDTIQTFAIGAIITILWRAAFSRRATPVIEPTQEQIR